MSRRLSGLQGGVVWALVPYDVAGPFTVTDEPGGRLTFQDGSALARAVRSRTIAPELKVEVRAKVRPVLLLQDRPAGRLREYGALKLTRIEKLDATARDAIRAQEAKRFLHLPDPARFGLGKQAAVDLLSLIRVHESAIVGAPKARLDPSEFRVVCERLVRVLDLDLADLVVAEAAELLKRREAP